MVCLVERDENGSMWGIVGGRLPEVAGFACGEISHNIWREASGKV